MDTLVKGIEQDVLQLWNEGMMPGMIARKLGLDQEKVEDIIEAPGNYLSFKAIQALTDF